MTGCDGASPVKKEQEVMDSVPTNHGRNREESAWVGALQEAWRWAGRALKPRKVRRLRVRESLSLGDRRFVAVIEFDGQEFLVGGGGTSLALLARLQEGKVIPEPPTPAENRSV